MGLWAKIPIVLAYLREGAVEKATGNGYEVAEENFLLFFIEVLGKIWFPWPII